jgi:hypothetical protein
MYMRISVLCMCVICIYITRTHTHTHAVAEFVPSFTSAKPIHTHTHTHTHAAAEFVPSFTPAKPQQGAEGAGKISHKNSNKCLCIANLLGH